jgi:hypothetical protein
MTTVNRTASSTEYLPVKGTADVDISNDQLDVSFDKEATWHPMENLGAVHDTTTQLWAWRARILIGPGNGGLALPVGDHGVRVKIRDTPEVPVLRAGTLTIST